MVDIAVVTYNQEKYIFQAIQSILEQECDFNYRIIIGDDCSSDNTYKICSDFADKNPGRIKLLRSSTNQGLVKNYQNVLYQCTAKYIAILEGDDYWIDPLKLQKQINILEAHKEIGLVHTGSYTLYENGEIKRNHLSTPRSMLEGSIFESLLVKKNTISPMTVMFRNELFKKYVDYGYFIEHDYRTIDYPLWLSISRYCDVSYLIEPTAIYRFIEDSVSRPQDITSIETFYNTALETKRHFFHMNPINQYTLKEVLSPVYFTLADYAIKFGNEKKAKEYAKNIVPKHFQEYVLKLTIQYSNLYPLYRAFLWVMTSLSSLKQVLFKLFK